MAATTLTRSTLAALAAAATLAGAGCEAPPVPEGKTRVEVRGHTFLLDLAIDDASRTRGLGGVEHIPEDGGMLFVFPSQSVQQFVMRDCVIDIDIAFLTDTGRVLAKHAMTVEEPQRDNESAIQYELRLTRYGSRGPCRFVVEVAGGTWARIELEVGDQFDGDFDTLKRLAR